MGTSEIALAISAIVMLFAILTFIFARSNDHGKREYWEGQTTNQLSAISEDVKDMKAQQRNYERQLVETKEIAILARQSASRAHKRLDAIDAPNAYEE